MAKDSEFQKFLGERLRDERERKKLTRDALSKLSSISDDMIKKYEQGIACPSAYAINLLCEALDVTPNKLYGFPTPSFGAHATEAAAIIDSMKESGKVWAIWALEGMKEKSDSILRFKKLAPAMTIDEIGDMKASVQESASVSQ